MAGPLLRVLIRLKTNKYHRLQIPARYRIIDLFQQIANELHLQLEQLIHLSIYRNSSNGYLLIYPLTTNTTVYDQLEKFDLSNNDELYIDLTLNESESDDDLPLNQQTTTTNLGQLIRYSVPADNSCLFSSIDFVLHNGKLDESSKKFFRNLIANKIEADQIRYSDAVLGRTNADYCQWIRRGKNRKKKFILRHTKMNLFFFSDDSWGGGIELSVLTEEYQVEICVINTESGGRIDYFGEDKKFPYRVFLFYDNLHYDPGKHKNKKTNQHRKTK